MNALTAASASGTALDTHPARPVPVGVRTVLQLSERIDRGEVALPDELTCSHVARLLAARMLTAQHRYAEIAQQMIEERLPSAASPEAFLTYLFDVAREGPEIEASNSDLYLFGSRGPALRRTGLAPAETFLVNLMTGARRRAEFFGTCSDVAGAHDSSVYMLRNCRVNIEFRAAFSWSTLVLVVLRHLLCADCSAAVRHRIALTIDAFIGRYAVREDAAFCATAHALVRDVLLGTVVSRRLARQLVLGTHDTELPALARHMIETLDRQLMQEACTPLAQEFALRCMRQPLGVGVRTHLLDAVKAVNPPSFAALLERGAGRGGPAAVACALALLYPPAEALAAVGADHLCLSPALRAALCVLPSAAAEWQFTTPAHVPAAHVLGTEFVLPLIAPVEARDAAVADVAPATWARFRAWFSERLVRGVSSDDIEFLNVPTGARPALTALRQPDTRTTRTATHGTATRQQQQQTDPVTVATDALYEHARIYAAHVARVREAMLQALRTHDMAVCRGVHVSACTNPRMRVFADHWSTLPARDVLVDKVVVNEPDVSPLELRVAYEAFVAWAFGCAVEDDAAAAACADDALRQTPACRTSWLSGGGNGAGLLLECTHGLAWRALSEFGAVLEGSVSANEAVWLAWRLSLRDTDILCQGMALMWYMCALVLSCAREGRAHQACSASQWARGVIGTLLAAWRPAVVHGTAPPPLLLDVVSAHRRSAWLSGLKHLGVDGVAALHAATEHVAAAYSPDARVPCARHADATRRIVLWPPPGTLLTQAEAACAREHEDALSECFAVPVAVRGVWTTNACAGIDAGCRHLRRRLLSHITIADIMHIAGRTPALLPDATQVRVAPQLSWWVERC